MKGQSKYQRMKKEELIAELERRDKEEAIRDLRMKIEYQPIKEYVKHLQTLLVME
jgi:hypothetical protein